MQVAPSVPVHPFEHTAAGRMTARIPIVQSGSALADIQALFWKSVGTFDTINTVFVVDLKGVLLGALPTKSVFGADLATAVDAVMIPFEKIPTVHMTDDQEVAVQVALAYTADSVAVIDTNRHLKGALSIKELMRILQHETQEDLAAVGAYDMSPKLDTILEVPIMRSFMHRAPWILVGVGGGTLVAFIVGFFEELLQTHIILVSFIPLVVYIVGAVSAQLQLLYIRDSAILPSFPLMRYAVRQGAVVVLLSVAIGAVLFGVGTFQNLGNSTLTIAVGVGVGILTSLLTGIAIPHILSRFVRDPANATAPIATIISDVLSISIFFITASFFFS